MHIFFPLFSLHILIEKNLHLNKLEDKLDAKKKKNEHAHNDELMTLNIEIKLLQ